MEVDEKLGLGQPYFPMWMTRPRNLFDTIHYPSSYEKTMFRDEYDEIVKKQERMAAQWRMYENHPVWGHKNKNKTKETKDKLRIIIRKFLHKEKE